jgi:hypothetical protein
MMNTNNQNTNWEIGDDLVITKKTRRLSAGGTWVRGSLNGHRFEALVFSEHAESESYELEDSRISKLWIQRIADKQEVVNFDRGWDRQPTDATAKAIVDFLAAGLAEHIYHD